MGEVGPDGMRARAATVSTGHAAGPAGWGCPASRAGCAPRPTPGSAAPPARPSPCRPRACRPPAASALARHPAPCRTQCKVAGRRAATEPSPARYAFPAGPSRTQRAPFSAPRSPASREVRPRRAPLRTRPWQEGRGRRASGGCRRLARSPALCSCHAVGSRCPLAPLPRACVPASCGLPWRLGRHLGYYGFSVAALRW